jgi:hypothetical protein
VFLETNHVTGEWPRREWELESLTLAAFYFSPELDLARAQWGTAQAGLRTAGQRPNPTLSVTPGYNTTTTVPSPWIVTPSLDIPIETAGKRGYRLTQAQHLSEAAQLAIASAAWDVRAHLRRALLELWSAQEAEAALAAQHAAQQEVVRLLEAQRDAGAATLVEVTREHIALEQTRVAWLDAQNRRTTARVQLATVIGVPSPALDGVNLSFDAFTQPPGKLPPAEGRRRFIAFVVENGIAVKRILGIGMRTVDGQAEVRKVAELAGEGYFGPIVSPKFRARAGELVILPYRGESVWWYEKDKFEQKYYGHHGGLTAQEMEIPLIMWEM